MSIPNTSVSERKYLAKDFSHSFILMLEMAGDAAKKSPQNPSSSAAKDSLAGLCQVSLPGWAIPVQEQPIYRSWWQVLFVSSSELSSWLSLSRRISLT